MLVCEKCNVSVRGWRGTCPLCQGPLTGEGDEQNEVFPVIPEEKQPFLFWLRLAVFVSIAAAVICLAVNAMFPQSGSWSLFAVAGIACTWLTLWVALKKLANIPKSILWQVAVVSVLAVLWDFCTGRHGWAINYVLPSLYVAAMAAMAVIARVLKLCTQDYMIYLVIDALFGVVPILFYLFGWLTVAYPSLICVAVSVISLAAFVVFQGENMRAELKRHLHL